MKRILAVLAAFAVLFSCCSCGSSNIVENEYTSVCSERMTGVWFTAMELAPAKGMSKADYKKKIKLMAENCADFGVTDAFVQVRYGCDSIYPSELFKPNSRYSEKGKLLYDCLKIIVQTFHKEKINVHAWINPYRISALSQPDGDDPIFDSVKREDIIFTSNGGSYLNPASERCNRLILSGIREILSLYDVDGIHIDDYFYPETDESIDSEEYEEYTFSGGTLSLSDWRRSCVSSLISSIYSLVKSFSEDLVFSISPCGDIRKNTEELYADVELWCQSAGYADVMIPQIYYGFENSSKPFENCLKEWRKLASGGKVKLLAGLAAYKVGKEDKFAGAGKDEWIENENILASQAELSFENTDGIVLFSYSYLFVDNKLTNSEINNLSSVIELSKEENEKG